MLVLETIPHETIWGGSRLSSLSNTKRVGHLYSLFCREGCSNRILNGKYRGNTLNQVFPRWKADFGMEECRWFPLTLALTEAGAHLSIQVHPNDAVARRLEYCPRGKRESWYFLCPPEEGWIFNGCTCSSEEALCRMLREGDYLGLADRLAVAKGDYVFVEPGTLHAITAGSLVYEIEEGADATYRLYDYGRIDEHGNSRPLQLKKAVEALEIQQKSEVKHYPPSGVIQEETYQTRRISDHSEYRNVSGTLECFTLIAGSVWCDGCALSPGMTVLLWPGEELREAEIQLAFVASFRGAGN